MTELLSILSPFELLTPTVITAGTDDDTLRTRFDGFRRALMFVGIDADDNAAWIDDAEVVISLMEADAITAGNTNVIRTIDVVGGVNATEVEIWTEDFTLDVDSIVVNGVPFACTTAGYAADRPLEWNSVAQLITGINANCDGVTAGGAVGTHGIPLTVDDPGSMVLNVTMDWDDPAGQLATMKACVAVEIYGPELDVGDDMEYFFLNIDNDHGLAGDITAYCVAAYGSPSHAPARKVLAAQG